MDLTKIRQQIDIIDAELVHLITRRMEYAIRTKRFKSEVEDSSREVQVLNRINNISNALVKSDFSQRLFKNILEESRRLQSLQTPLVAFHGEHGAYAESALAALDSTWIGIPHRELSAIVDGVETGAVDYGILPIENAVEGAEQEVQDLLIESNLKIIAEIKAPVHHALMTTHETDYRDIKEVFSHPRALSQCRGFLKRNRLEGKAYYDSAGAALMLLRDRPSSAAVICSVSCAQLYDLEILKEGIQDFGNNATRYIVVGKASSHENGSKCSVVFVTPHRAGALLEALSIFSKASINLTRIESRPLRKDPTQVAFLLDFSGSENDSKIQGALSELEKHSLSFRFLGCYRELEVL